MKESSRLLNFIRQHTDPPSFACGPEARGAAVLIPLVEKEDGVHLLFEVRSFALDVQPGEVCFPGGGIEGCESAEEAAVRETMEELLVERGQIECLAVQPELTGPGGVAITPLLGLLKDYRGGFSSAEVDHVFTVPLRWFIEHPPKRYVTKLVTVLPEDFPYEKIPGGRHYNWRARNYDVYFYDDHGRDASVLWGVTAKIVRAFVLRYFPNGKIPFFS